MKKKNLKLNFNKETIAKLQMNEAKGGTEKKPLTARNCNTNEIHFCKYTEYIGCVYLPTDGTCGGETLPTRHTTC